MESIVDSICKKIYEEWKHEGFICGCSSRHINFELDQKEYVLLIREIGEGEHWSEMSIERMTENESET
jgi:hypothetical protein